jgi:hypothetical protein
MILLYKQRCKQVHKQKILQFIEEDGLEEGIANSTNNNKGIDRWI